MDLRPLPRESCLCRRAGQQAGQWPHLRGWALKMAAAMLVVEASGRAEQAARAAVMEVMEVLGARAAAVVGMGALGEKVAAVAGRVALAARAAMVAGRVALGARAAVVAGRVVLAARAAAAAGCRCSCRLAGSPVQEPVAQDSTVVEGTSLPGCSLPRCCSLLCQVQVARAHCRSLPRNQAAREIGRRVARMAARPCCMHHWCRCCRRGDLAAPSRGCPAVTAGCSRVLVQCHLLHAQVWRMSFQHAHMLGPLICPPWCCPTCLTLWEVERWVMWGLREGIEGERRVLYRHHRHHHRLSLEGEGCCCCRRRSRHQEVAGSCRCHCRRHLSLEEEGAFGPHCCRFQMEGAEVSCCLHCHRQLGPEAEGSCLRLLRRCHRQVAAVGCWYCFQGLASAGMVAGATR